MELLDYIGDKDRKAKLAADVGCSPAYLYLVASEWKKGDKTTLASPDLVIAIERATGGEVLAGVGRGMRPDVQFVRDAAGVVTGHFVPAPAASAA